MPKAARALMLGGFYIEVDISNCQMAILYQLALSKGYTCAAMKRYVDHRDEIRAEIMATAPKKLNKHGELVDASLDDVKEAIIALYFGAGRK
jgi:hypothetical protein